MSVSLTYATTLTSVETLATNVPAASAVDNTITHNGYNTSTKLTASTTPPVTVCAYFLQALSTGTATIDLTSLTGTNGATVNGTGLKVQAIKFKATANNANALTIATGASNGYALGGASFSVALAAGQEFVMYGNDATPDVGPSAKTLDLSGTGSQSVQVSIVLG